MAKSTPQTIKAVVVIPNLNGGAELLEAVQSLTQQTLQPRIIVVDNASTDNSVAELQKQFPEVELIQHTVNKGYAGGVNPGFRRAMELQAAYVAPFNDDAVADPKWLETLVNALDAHPHIGAAACKVLAADGKHLDSTGDYYTSWGLAYPRGRGEVDHQQYDDQTDIFGASGAASLYRVAALQEVGLLDEDFFAYYEDVDLSFRLQLAGWKVLYVPQATVTHKIGMTSSRIKGFTTYQTMKNLPLVAFKNVPRKYRRGVTWRLTVARWFFLARAITRGQGWWAIKGGVKATLLLIKKRPVRRHIQATKKVSDEYIWSIITHDLPPNAQALRKLRSVWWRLSLTRKREV
jgi:GT2 family glycosyltransferase